MDNNKTNLEIEHKFLVKMPDTNALVSRYHPVVHIIEQVYLTAETGERRIRSRIAPYGDSDYMYKFWYTEKFPADETGFKRIENERELHYREYNELLKEADPDLKKICKTRYNFYIEGQLYELDVFAFDAEFAILEVELESEDSHFAWPELLTKISDVTEDSRYKNHNIAKTLAFPPLEKN
mgnify:CR=1 FL=1